jgi:major cell surface glycoprotein (TIGR04216 family)
MSVIAIAGAGLGAEVERGGDEPTFNPGVGGPNTVVVSEDKPVVFRGERNIDFVTTDGEPVDPANLIGVSGNAEGIPFEVPIPVDQALGQYTFDGESANAGVTVQQPRVTELELFNERGTEVTGASINEDETVLVSAEWNFEEAEDLSLIVRDDEGNDVTGSVLADEGALSDAQRQRLSGPYAQFPEAVANPGQRGTETGLVYLQGLGQFNESQLNASSQLDAAYWALDLSDLEAGDYTITVEGWDDLDTGAATRSTTISVSTENDVTLDVRRDSATRGQNIQYTIRGSDAGARHYVTVEAEDFRNNRVTEDVFRDVSDTVDTGTLDTDGDGEADLAWAEIEINQDTGLGVGQLDTTFLDDARVDINLYQADRSLQDVAANLGNTEDDDSLNVEQGELAIIEPDGTYIAGSEADVEGSAPPGIDDVVLYVRDQGDWELLDINEDGQLDNGDTLSVDSLGEFDREDVVLSEASDILSIPGRYRFGVVEAEDARDEDGNIRTTLTTSEFSSATSGQTTIIVEEPGLGTQAFQTYDGEIAVEDGTVDVQGVAPGLDDVLVVLIDSRGRVVTDRVSVDDDDTFEEDDISLVTQNGQELNEGDIRGIILGLGRDGIAGDGILPGQIDADIAGLESYILSVSSNRALTQAQVIERILDETTGDVASDDLVIQESFEYTDGSTSIETVRNEGTEVTGINDVSVGSTMEILGVTNRKPDDNTITVEVVEGPSSADFNIASTDEWDNDGVWSVTLDTDGVEPGTYVIEVDDGDSTDEVTIQIVEEQATPTETATATETETATATVTEPATETATATGTAAALRGGAPSAFSAMGSITLAVVLLVASIALSVRRD